MAPFRRFRAALVGPDPDPQPSRLDLLDGVMHEEPPYSDDDAPATRTAPGTASGPPIQEFTAS